MATLSENDVSIIDEKRDENESSRSTIDVSYVMTELHEFLKRVFQKLPAQSLLKCSRVCKRWKSVATFVLQSRDKFTWAQYNYHIHQGSKDSGPADQIVPNDLGYFGMDLLTCLKESWSVPASCLFFSEFTMTKEFHGSPVNSGNYSVVGIHNYLTNILPQSCDIVAVSVPGTICTTRNLTASSESEGEGGAVAILFPRMEGVQITRHSVRHPGKGNIWEQTGIERHQNVKCVLTFTPRSKSWSSCEKLQEAFLKDGQKPVIAGAIVNHSFSDKKSTAEFIVFSGERVSAASVLLDANVDNEEHVIRELTLLKNAGLSENNSVGLMFACIGRGSEFYSDWDVESKAFRKIFPKTPLFGVFGNGEIGCTNLPKSKWKNVPEMAHGYTTIMCLISFG